MVRKDLVDRGNVYFHFLQCETNHCCLEHRSDHYNFHGEANANLAGKPINWRMRLAVSHKNQSPDTISSGFDMSQRIESLQTHQFDASRVPTVHKINENKVVSSQIQPRFGNNVRVVQERSS
jgi:hypothetical protein